MWYFTDTESMIAGSLARERIRFCKTHPKRKVVEAVFVCLFDLNSKHSKQVGDVFSCMGSDVNVRGGFLARP